MNITIDTENLEILQDFFNELSVKDQTDIWMSAFRRSAKPLIQTAQALIPYKSKDRTPSYGLHRSFGIVPYKKNIGIWVGSRVGTYTVRQGKLSKVWYGRLVEWDHKKRGKKRGEGIGVVSGSHFFEKAVDINRQGISDSIGRDWVKSIESYMKKVDKKFKKKIHV